MRTLAYLLIFLGVIGVGFWAYSENYKTQQALKQVAQLNGQISKLREALAIQRAEWAYLNRPDRLRELATINFDRLGLLPMRPEQFVSVRRITYPVPVPVLDPDLPQIINPVDVMGEIAPEDQEITP